MRKTGRGRKSREKLNSRICLRLMSCIAALGSCSMVACFYSWVKQKATEFKDIAPLLCYCQWQRWIMPSLSSGLLESGSGANNTKCNVEEKMILNVPVTSDSKQTKQTKKSKTNNNKKCLLYVEKADGNQKLVSPATTTEGQYCQPFTKVS